MVEAEGLPERRRLLAGEDYPASYRGFVEMFPDEAACLRYLERLRWREGFSCPNCGAPGEPWRASRERLVCRACRRQSRVAAGTIFDKTRTPLTSWFEAAWHLTTAKNGMSAVTLAGTLGTSYAVAWPMLHRYRVAMVRAERARLSGEVEVDETFVGGIVVVALEIKRPRGFGRVRLRHVPDASGDSLMPFVCDMVMLGSNVLTDGWGGYNDLPAYGYTRKKVVLSASLDAAQVAMPGVHRVASLLKRWTSQSRGLVFRRLLEQAVLTGPVTEADVAHGYPWPSHHNT